EEMYTKPQLSSIGGVYKFTSEFDLDRLIKSILSVINLSPIFGSTFKKKANGLFIQKYCSNCFSKKDISVFSDNKKFQKYKNNVLNNGLNIYTGPLVKIGILKTIKDGELFILFHHSIMDAYAIGLVSKNIFDTYERKSHTEMTDYSEYIKYQNKYLESTQFDDDKRYWRNRYKDFTQNFQLLPEKIESGRLKLILKDKYIEKWIKFVEDNKLNENIFLITLLCIYKSKLFSDNNGILAIP
ncbi:condensation domain-containing protein, partial [Bombilactobacillus bombi]|uniref:condensation domain-containing protein n=1 Tax=Bombilactobacillus bombi TaxID=1303590 RepID=UPI002159E207